MQNEVKSAFEMRNAIKKNQAEQASMRLFTQFGTLLFEEGWQPETAHQILDAMCGFIGANHGLIATQQAGTLTIIASKGQTFPVGARIPMVGIYASLLKFPVHFDFHLVQQSRLWTHPEQTQELSFIAPIAVKQQPIGLLAFSCKSHLGQEALTQLQALCGFIGQAMMQSEKMANTLDQSVLNALTPREREVFALLPAGHSNAELAEKLGISPGTVKIHVERILAKLNLRDRTQAAVKAVEFGYKAS
jgi:RNA polymerase sigma factor (sigma-70 family)